MNEDIIDIIEPISEPILETRRMVEAPRPLVPKRTIIKFKITDERNNSEG